MPQFGLHTKSSMHMFSKRASLQELGNEIFKLVSYSATSEQWAEWLRVPLEHAVARGNLDLVDTLLQAGADGSAGWRGCRGRTLLHAAAVGGNPDVLTALLGAGARPDVNVVSLSPKRSALYVAMVCGHEEVARRLVQAGADVKYVDPVDQCSILHEAACWANEQLVNDLLIGGADPISGFGPRGSTPLHLAALSGHTGIISTLLLRGANKDALAEDGATPLLNASERGHVTAVETLLAAGADFKIRDVDGDSALDGAAAEGHIPVIKAILGYGADVNSSDGDGLSALHRAAVNSQAGAVDALVEAGADVELTTICGETPLFYACCVEPLRSGEALLALLKQGAAVMARDTDESTPLHEACYHKPRGLEVTVSILLRWGADETAADKYGRTPADMLNLASPFENVEPQGSQEDVERVHLLLARAPADRAWRRRGWLVMLRSRASKVEVASNDNGGCSNIAGIQERERRQIARTKIAAGVEHGMRGQASSSGGLGAGGELSDIVAVLLGLELDGLFRTVVSFL